MDSEVQCRLTKASRRNPILSRISPIPHIATSYLYLDLPKNHFHVGLPVKHFKALLLPSILATYPYHLNLLDLITLQILGERCKL